MERSCAGCVPSVHSTIPVASLPPFSLLCFLPQLLLLLLGSTVSASSVGLFEHQSPEYPHGMEQTGVVGLVPGGCPREPPWEGSTTGERWSSPTHSCLLNETQRDRVR